MNESALNASLPLVRLYREMATVYTVVFVAGLRRMMVVVTRMSPAVTRSRFQGDYICEWHA